MLLDDVAEFLVENGITPVFKAQMPDSSEFAPEKLVTIYEYSGMEPVWVHPQDQISPAHPKYEQPRLQVSVRGNKEDYESARSFTWTVFNVISSVVNKTLGATRYQSIHPLQSPFFMRWDGNRRPIFAFNCEVFKEFG